MDWGDILIKIGVGACLGFGIITLAKLAIKKNEKGQKSSNPVSSSGQGVVDRGDAKRNDR